MMDGVSRDADWLLRKDAEAQSGGAEGFHFLKLIKKPGCVNNRALVGY